jgi:hypothetical protein
LEKAIKNLSGESIKMKRIWINKAKSFNEAKEWDRKFWRRAGSHARFAAAYEILKEYMKIKGKNASSLRLKRSVQNIERLKNE